jgi:hypothetical protein
MYCSVQKAFILTILHIAMAIPGGGGRGSQPGGNPKVPPPQINSCFRYRVYLFAHTFVCTSSNNLCKTSDWPAIPLILITFIMYCMHACACVVPALYASEEAITVVCISS